MELPEYVCHKRVRAAKITGIFIDSQAHLGGAKLHFEGGVDSVIVPEVYMLKHAPTIGGYFVQYEDGYQSFSPGYSFEVGYTKVAA